MNIADHQQTNCEDCVNLLMDYLDSNLDPETLRQLDEHFSACPPCVNFLNTYKSCLAMNGKATRAPLQIPSELEDRLRSFLHSELLRPSQ